MKTLDARIRWNTEADGCLESPFSGIRPSMRVAGELITCRVERADGAGEMERGGTYEVMITLPYGEHYAEHLTPGMDVRLQVGGRVLGEGSVTRVRGEG